MNTNSHHFKDPSSSHSAALSSLVDMREESTASGGISWAYNLGVNGTALPPIPLTHLAKKSTKTYTQGRSQVDSFSFVSQLSPQDDDIAPLGQILDEALDLWDINQESNLEQVTSLFQGPVSTTPLSKDGELRQ